MTAGDNDMAASERAGSIELVARKDDRGAGGGGFDHEGVEQVAAGGIEAGVRLVEQPQLGVAHEHGRQRRPAALPGRQPPHGDGAEALGHPRPLEGAADRHGTARGFGPEAHVLLGREVLVEASGVPKEGDVPADGASVTLEVMAEDDRFASAHGHQTGDGAQQGRLPGTIGALEEDDFTSLDVEIDASEGWESAQQADRGAEVDGGVHRDRENGTGGVDEPPKRHLGIPWRRVINRTGRILIWSGVLVLLFVVYELWGTNIQEARSQHKLRAQFERTLKVVTPTTLPGEPPPPTPAGDAVAMLRIPKIGVEKAVIEGVGVPDLKKGPGHYPTTPLPGQQGNAAIAGHRTTYGAPFYRLDELAPGDEILVTTLQGHFKFKVENTHEVAPSDTSVLEQTLGAQLTLTTCTPRFSAKRRLVVVASLVSEPAPTPVVTVVTHKKMVDVVVKESLSGDRQAAWPTFWWSLLLIAIALVTSILRRRFGRLRVYALSVPIFLLVLYVFFENMARLLPANI